MGDEKPYEAPKLTECDPAEALDVLTGLDLDVYASGLSIHRFRTEGGFLEPDSVFRERVRALLPVYEAGRAARKRLRVAGEVLAGVSVRDALLAVLPEIRASFTINQKFEDADPDRLIKKFKADLDEQAKRANGFYSPAAAEVAAAPAPVVQPCSECGETPPEGRTHWCPLVPQLSEFLSDDILRAYVTGRAAETGVKPCCVIGGVSKLRGRACPFHGPKPEVAPPWVPDDDGFGYRGT